MRPNGNALAQSGHTVLELLIAVSLFAIVFLSSMALMESGQRLSHSTIEITVVEEQAQLALFKVERMLANAVPNAPSTTAASLPAGAGTVTLASNDGFPPRGFAVLSPGTALQEVVGYDGLGAAGELFSLQRAQQCTGEQVHVQATAQWAGVAEPWSVAGPTTRRSLEQGVPTDFRGAGLGFSFLVPVDPAGGRTFVQANKVRWGAPVRDVGQTVNGRMAIYFQPQTTFDEAAENADVNGDGDRVDVFDVGQVRRVAWDVTAPSMADDVGLGASCVIQERCQWGSDLDGDGFDDPMFLWNEDSKELHVRLFVLGASKSGLPVVRRVESFVFLRNEEASS